MSTQLAVRSASQEDWMEIERLFPARASVHPTRSPLTNLYIVHNGHETAGIFALTEIDRLTVGSPTMYLLHSRLVTDPYRNAGVPDAVFSWCRSFHTANPASQIVLLVPVDRDGAHFTLARSGLTLELSGYSVAGTEDPR